MGQRASQLAFFFQVSAQMGPFWQFVWPLLALLVPSMASVAEYLPLYFLQLNKMSINHNLYRPGQPKFIQTFISDHRRNPVQQLFLKWSRLQPIDMLYLSLQKWNNVIFINLLGNNLSNKGCKYLSRANISNLQTINLGDNQIEGIGVMHLLKTQWKKLDAIFLNYNRIKLDGLCHFIRMYNPNFVQIYLNDNMLTHQQITKVILLPNNNRNLYIHLSDNAFDKEKGQKIKSHIQSKCIDANIYV